MQPRDKCRMGSAAHSGQGGSVKFWERPCLHLHVVNHLGQSCLKLFLHISYHLLNRTDVWLCAKEDLQNGFSTLSPSIWFVFNQIMSLTKCSAHVQPHVEEMSGYQQEDGPSCWGVAVGEEAAKIVNLAWGLQVTWKCFIYEVCQDGPYCAPERKIFPSFRRLGMVYLDVFIYVLI